MKRKKRLSLNLSAHVNEARVSDIAQYLCVNRTALQYRFLLARKTYRNRPVLMLLLHGSILAIRVKMLLAAFMLQAAKRKVGCKTFK